MANYPNSMPSSTPATHNDVLNEIIAIATELGTTPKGEYSSVTARLNAARASKRRVLPESFGATGNARQVYDANITAASAVLTSASAAFTSADVGRTVQVVGAGSGATSSLVTTISTFTSATSVTLAATATTTVTGGVAVIGTDDQAALSNCLASLGVGDAMYLDPTKAYLHSSQLAISQNGSGVIGRGILIGTDQTNHTLHVTASDVLVDGVTLRMNADSRQTTPQTAALWADGCARLTVRNVYVDGAGSAGLFIYGATEFELTDCTVQNTKADGVHMTFGARDGLVKRPITRYCGDDGVAVISYQGDGVICSDISIMSPRVLGETGGRGIAVVGGQDVVITDAYVERAWQAGIYIGSESSYSTYGVSRIRVLGAKLLQCNASVNNGNGAVTVLADAPGMLTDDVRLEAFVLEDTPYGLFDQVKLSVTNGTMSRVLLSQFTINGGATEPFTNNGAASIVTRLNWVVDNRAVPDAVGWGGFTGRAWADGTAGRYYTGAAFNGAANIGQIPTVGGEILTPGHSGRGTRLLTATESGKLWFVRVEQVRKSNLPYGYGQPFTGIGISVNAAQSAGTTAWRAGVYADDGSGSRPTGAALFDAGAGAALTTTGDKFTTVSWTVTPGVYWLAFGYQETSTPTTRPTLVTFTGGRALASLDLTTTAPGVAWFQTGFVGANALPTVGTLTRESNPPLIGLKIP